MPGKQAFTFESTLASLKLAYRPVGAGSYRFRRASVRKDAACLNRCSLEVARSCSDGLNDHDEDHHVLWEIIARFSLPQQVFSDNGPQFTSSEFQQIISSNGVKHITTATYYPSSNGAAERLVQTVKQAVRAGLQRGDSLQRSLAAFLLRYRAKPHATTGVSSCALFMGRHLCTRMDLLKPDIGGIVKDNEAR